MGTPKIIRNYEHAGKVVGKLVEYPAIKLNPVTNQFVSTTERRFETELGEFNVVDLVRELEPEDRVHMKTKAYGLYRTLQHFEINPDDYIDDEDLVIHCMNKGYKS